MKLKRESHAKQRALLSHRLQREERARAAIREKQEQMEAEERAIAEARQQPKPEEVEKDISSRYGAIDDLGERSFAILVDLGLVNVSPDPKASDYDASQDDEFVQ